MGRPKKYHSDEEKRMARKQWDSSYYRKNQDEIKAKMQLAYRAARARYEREHDLPPKYSYKTPEPINFVQCSKRVRPSRVEKELSRLREQHDLWLSTMDHSPRKFLETTYMAIVASETQSNGEKIAQHAYEKLSVAADEVQAIYYRLMELRGEGDASALRAKAVHQKMSPSTEACLDMWGLCAENVFPSALVNAYEKNELMFQQW